MKKFNSTIALAKNSRGCYILDTVKGCSGCNEERPNGCYGDCYAKNIANRYNIDFIHPVTRKTFNDGNQLYFMDFHDGKHIGDIMKKLRKIDMPFVRIGEMGDPSENWEHTISVCNVISMAKKPIVIITKHWKTIPENIIDNIKMLDITINTSISALDSDTEITHRLEQYNRLKKYCNSVLRIVSCDFNTDNINGARMYNAQEKLFNNANIIDTVFRPSKNNKYLEYNIIKATKEMFLRTEMLVSKYNKDAYLGTCDTCPDMCGVKA